MDNEIKDTGIEEGIQNLFGTSGVGDELLLKIAANYSTQLNIKQIKIILYLEALSKVLPEKEGKILKDFIERWIELKQFNNSAPYIMKALYSISLKKFIGENAFKVNIEK